MKHLCLLLALCASLMTVSVATATAADSNQDAAGASDPNFRWHRGQWWYWQAPQHRWMVWNGKEWQAHQPPVVRTHSYSQDVSQNVIAPTYRSNTSTRSRSHSGRITESFGHRDAGSKVRGNY